MKVLDGRADTAWSPAVPRPGTGRAETLRLRQLTIDLHGPAMVSALRYTPGRKPLGRIGRYVIHVSFEGQTWQRVAHGRWADSAQVKATTFAPVPAGRVRLSVRSGAGKQAQGGGRGRDRAPWDPASPTYSAFPASGHRSTAGLPPWPVERPDRAADRSRDGRLAA